MPLFDDLNQIKRITIHDQYDWPIHDFTTYWPRGDYTDRRWQQTGFDKDISMNDSNVLLRILRATVDNCHIRIEYHDRV